MERSGEAETGIFEKTRRLFLLVLVVHVDDLLDLVARAQEDTALVVDMLGRNLHQPLHARVDG